MVFKKKSRKNSVLLLCKKRDSDLSVILRPENQQHFQKFCVISDDILFQNNYLFSSLIFDLYIWVKFPILLKIQY